MAFTQPRALPGGANWVGGYTSPEEIAKKQLADVKAADAKMKLTWNPDKPPNAPLDRVVGRLELVDKDRNIYRVIGVNLSLPYMRVGTYEKGRSYYIQNAKLFKSNGDETTMDAIRLGEPEEIYLSIKKAYETFMADAFRRDDALCKLCGSYRSKDHEDYLKHMLSLHPDHVQDLLGVTAPEVEPVPATVEASPIKAAVATSGLSCCGKTFKDKRGLVGHNRFVHTKRA